MAVTVMAAAARMEATMIAVMVFSPFTDFLPCSAGGDQSDHDGCGGDDDGSDDEFHGFFSSLFFGQRVAIRVTMTAADARMEVTMIAVMILYLFLFLFLFFGVLSVPLDTHTIPQPARNLCGL